MVIRPLVHHVTAPDGGTVSVLAARPALEELDRRGVDVEPVLRRAHLSRDLFESDERRLPHRSVADLWEAAAEAAADRWLAVHVAETLAAGSFDVYDYLIATADTVGDGLEAAARYAGLVHGDSAWRLSLEQGEARLVRHVQMPSPQLDELAVVSVLVRSRRASGIDWAPERLAFQHRRHDDDGELARRCGCAVEFGAAETELRLAPEHLGAPHLGADPRLFAILARHADGLRGAAPSGDELVAAVSASIARQLPGAPPDLASTAATLNLSVRTLQRRLAENGVTHSALLDDVRRRLALELVGHARVPIAEIAKRLGFADSTAFHRAFRRWTDEAPTEYRRRHRPA